MSISLCMIVKDEAATLSDCLESVRDLVDAMVVVDTGSSDRTLEIAKSAGANIFSFDWCDDFSAARNYALQQVQSEWVLVLDADEVLVPEMLPVLKAATQDENCLVVNLIRQELGVHQVPYSSVSRLFRRHPQIRYSLPYHESIDDSVIAILNQEPRWKVLELAGVALRHSGYEAATIAQRQKTERARSIMEGYLSAHPNDPYICNKLGALYLATGDTARGRELLQGGLQTSSLEPAICYELNYHLACTYSQSGDFEQADKHFQTAIEQPISRYLKLGAYTNWGTMRVEQGNPAAAIVLFQTAIEIAPGFVIGYFNLGTALKTVGNLEGAIACYQQAIAIEPTYAEAHQGLGVTLMKGGRILESLDSFRKAISLYHQQGSPEAERLQQVLKEMHLLQEGGN